jgi:hypothetical protein
MVGATGVAHHLLCVCGFMADATGEAGAGAGAGTGEDDEGVGGLALAIRVWSTTFVRLDPHVSAFSWAVP